MRSTIILVTDQDRCSPQRLNYLRKGQFDLYIYNMYKCNKCSKELKTKNGKTNHEKRCDGNGTKSDKVKASWGAIWNCPLCGHRIKSQRKKHLEFCNGLGPRRTRKGPGLGWSKGLTKETDERIAKISKGLIGVSKGIGKTEETEKIRRDKIRTKINERYANGWEVKCGKAKKYTYVSEVAGEIKVDGRWELATAKYLDEIKVKWIRNKQRFKYFNTITNKSATYCPDFYVEDWNMYIEVKGYTTDLDKCKWEQFEYKLEIWNKEILKSKNIIDNYGLPINTSIV